MRAIMINQLFPQEKVYLHFDNTSYYLGETMWFKAYVVGTADHTLRPQSKVLYVELVAPEGYIVETKKYKLDDKGCCSGEFDLKESILSGYYTVRAYTRYMLNWGDEAIFARTFPVYDAVSDGHYEIKDMLDPTTRSFSAEESIIAAEIQAKLDSIGTVCGKEFVLTEGTDVSKIDEKFFEFIEKSLLVEESDSNRMIPVSMLNKDSLIDDSSVNKIGVRTRMSTETGYYTWETERLFECDLCFKFEWTVGPIGKNSVKGSIVYDTNKYTLSSFTYSPPVGEASNITIYYTATIKEKFGMGNLIKTYTGLL